MWKAACSCLPCHTVCPSFYHPAGTEGQQGEPATSFLATLASSSTEEMEAELQERLESSQKQVTRVVELYEGLKSTVERLRVEPNAGAGGERGRAWSNPIWIDPTHACGWVGVGWCVRAHVWMHHSMSDKGSSG